MICVIKNSKVFAIHTDEQVAEIRNKYSGLDIIHVADDTNVTLGGTDPRDSGATWKDARYLLSALELDSPFRIKSAFYSNTNADISVLIAPGIGETFSGNTINTINKTSDTTFKITPVSASTTYTIYLKNDGNFASSTDGTTSIGSILIGTISTNVDKSVNTIIDKRPLISGVGKELIKHKADYTYQTPIIVETQIQIQKQGYSNRLYFKLENDLSGGNITISLDEGLTSLPLKNIDGENITELEKGYVEVVDNTVNFTLVVKKGGEYIKVEYDNYIPSGYTGSRVKKNIEFENTIKLSQARTLPAATSIGDYALFGGGEQGSSTNMSTVDAYNKNLVRTNPTALSQARALPAATSIGDYALFGGGYPSNIVDAYDKNLTRIIPTPLSSSKRYVCASTFIGRAFFVGGYVGGVYADTSDVYDNNLTKTSPISLSVARGSVNSLTSTPTHLIYGGGLIAGDVATNIVDAFNVNLIRIIPSPLSQARWYPSGGSIGEFALFAGGNVSGANMSAVVDIYDKELTRSASNELKLYDNSSWLINTVIGDYLLFNNSGDTDKLNIYSLELLLLLLLPKGSKYKFDNDGEEQVADSNEINVIIPINGYIKYKKGGISNEV